jgi:hypothetical protein
MATDVPRAARYKNCHVQPFDASSLGTLRCVVKTDLHVLEPIFSKDSDGNLPELKEQ